MKLFREVNVAFSDSQDIRKRVSYHPPIGGGGEWGGRGNSKFNIGKRFFTQKIISNDAKSVVCC